MGKAFVEMHPKIQKERYITKQKWDDGDRRARHLLRGRESEGSAGLSESQAAFVCYQGGPDYRHTHINTNTNGRQSLYIFPKSDLKYVT